MLSLFQNSLDYLFDFAVSLPELPLDKAAESFPNPPLRINPLAIESGPFLHLLHRLDRISYAPIGLDMPRWALYDCGELPGIVAGYGCRAKDTPENVRDLLEVPPGYDGLVPLSMAILIPQPSTGAWLCYSLCSINEIAPGSAPAHLRLLTLITILTRLEMSELWGIHQWRSPNMGFMSRLGPLRLISAYTPAHTEWRTLTYSVSVNNWPPESLLMNPRPAWGVPTFLLDCDDREALVSLQKQVENSTPAWVVGGPDVVGDRTLFPIKLGQPGDEAP